MSKYMIKKKLDYIVPNIDGIIESIIEPNKNYNKFSDIINFIFSIQDMYVYNPLQYINMIENIEAFFLMYKQSLLFFNDINNNFSIDYQLMTSYKNNALNSLQSLSLTIPDDMRVKIKLGRAVDILNKILINYLNQISYLSDIQINKYGYNIRTKIIDHGPRAFNDYDSMYVLF